MKKIDLKIVDFMYEHDRLWVSIEDYRGVIYTGSLELDEEKSERLAKRSDKMDEKERLEAEEKVRQLATEIKDIIDKAKETDEVTSWYMLDDVKDILSLW